MAWIESHQSLSRHRKTTRAVSILRVDRHKLIGHLHSLWWWAIDNVGSDGSLGDLTDDEVAQAAEWTQDAALFVGALSAAGFIDSDESGGRCLHDWYDYAGKYLCRREVNSERMRRARAAHEGDTVQRTCNARATHVQVEVEKMCGATNQPTNQPTVPTVPMPEHGDKEKDKYMSTAVPAVTPPADAVATPPVDPVHLDLAECLRNAILASKPDARVPSDLTRWATTARLMIERDHRTPDSIAAVIQYAQGDDFWRANVLSMDKLRTQFDRLELQMQRVVRGARASPHRDGYDQAREAFAMLAREGVFVGHDGT